MNGNGTAATQPTTSAQIETPIAPTASLARVEPNLAEKTLALVMPKSFGDIERLAVIVANTGLCGVKSKDEAVVRLMQGLELGLGLMQALRGLYVYDGRPGMYADLMVGICLSHPEVCEYFRCVETTRDRAVYATKRVGQPEQQLEYSAEDAKAAGLLDKKGAWQSSRRQMLRARSSSELARMVYPDLLNGMYTPDELDQVADDRRGEMRGEVVSNGSETGAQSNEATPEQVAKCNEVEAKIRAATSTKQLSAAGAAMKEALAKWKITPGQETYLRTVYSEIRAKAEAAIAKARAEKGSPVPAHNEAPPPPVTTPIPDAEFEPAPAAEPKPARQPGEEG